MGRRYTDEEKHQIQELTEGGHPDFTIAQELGRSTNATLNYRRRNNIKVKENKTIQQLKHEK